MPGIDAPQRDGAPDPAAASAGSVGVDQPALGSRECDDVGTRPRQPLAVGSLVDLQDVRRFGAIHLEDLSQDVGQAMRPVEAGQHPERAADLHLLEEQGVVHGARFG